MKRLVKYEIILLIILLLINLIGFFSKNISCTQKSCGCYNNKGSKISSGEVECNNCSEGRFLLITGLFNLYKSRSGIEILTCEEGEVIDEKVNYKEWRYSWITLFNIYKNE